MNRYLFLLAIAVVIVSTALIIDAQSRPQHVAPPRPSANDAIHAAGRVEGATREIELRPQFAGRVAQVAVAEGDLVAVGQLLFRLDDDVLRHEVAVAAADLKLAEARLAEQRTPAHADQRREAEAQAAAKRAELDLARLLLERAQKLRRENAIPQQEVDEQQAKVDSLAAQAEAAIAHRDYLRQPARPEEIAVFEARVAAARSALELATAQLNRSHIRAPHTCRVLRCNIEVGELANPQSAEPAMILADTSRLRVRAFVEELDAPRVQIGMTAKILADGLPGKSYTGQVTRLSPQMTWNRLATDNPRNHLDAKTREVWIDLDPPVSDLIVGLRVDLTLSSPPQSATSR